MTLPKTIMDFLNKNASRNGVMQLREDDNLFNAGALDSFELIELITRLEQEYGVKIPDVDVDPANFQSIGAIERYIKTRKS